MKPEHKLRFFLLISSAILLLNGCVPSEETTRKVEGQHKNNTIGSTYSTTSDTIYPGPTKRGEQESTDKQKQMVTTIIVVAAIVFFIGSLAWAGADR